MLLSARAVTSIGRVWADGKLLRDAGGAWLTPVTMRLHTGGNGQAADPLMVAAEGASGTPAYRGTAYAVFEDLPLADYGNRIPNLTFEVVADGSTDAGAVVAALAPDGVAIAGAFPALGGFAAAQAGSARDQLGQLTELYDLRYIDDGVRLTVRAGPAAGGGALAAVDLGSHDASASPHAARTEVRGAAGQLDDAVAIGFHDPSRDWQPGLQRAVRRPQALRVAQVDIAAGLDAATAKGLATDLLARRSAARVSATFNLPPRALKVRAGDAVMRTGDDVPWSARRWTFSNFVSELAVERRSARLAEAVIADPGRSHEAGDEAAGQTRLEILDLPPVFGEVGDTPRLWIAAAGVSPGWRRSAVTISADGGETYAHAGEAGAASVIGATTAPLAAGCDDRWDRESRIEVELLSDAMWLESRSEAAVLSGANLAVVGDEIVQFSEVEPLGARRFALTTLLRGRRGSAAVLHPAGARFVLLDPDRMLGIDPGLEAVGRTLRLRAAGSGDAATPAVLHAFAGNAVRPLSPVRLSCRADGGDAVFGWVRRSRAGFAWADAVDAPLGEAAEQYAVEVMVAGQVVRMATVEAPAWRYIAADRTADRAGSGTQVAFSVVQLGALGGPAARAAFILS